MLRTLRPKTARRARAFPAVPAFTSSPATYLPIRIVIGGLRQDYRWLAPTTANLAMLKVRIPPRFRRINNATGP